MGNTDSQNNTGPGGGGGGLNSSPSITSTFGSIISGTNTPVGSKITKEEGQDEYEAALKDMNDCKFTQAAETLQKVIDNYDYFKARLLLGQIYRDGRGDVQVDANRAIEIFLGGNTKDGQGECQVGLMYLKGLGGLERDYVKAMGYFNTARENDNMDALSHIGFIHVTTGGMEASKGMQELTEAANADPPSPEAHAYLGLIHMEGIGTAINYTLAIEHLNRAVSLGQLDAHVYLADLHFHGRGTDRTPWAAAKLLLKAAEKGHPRAQCFIGMMYRDGIGVVNNPNMALKWLRASAFQRDTLGMYSWGKYLLESKIDYDWEKVVEWLRRAAEKGNVDGALTDDIYMDGLARIFKLEEV